MFVGALAVLVGAGVLVDVVVPGRTLEAGQVAPGAFVSTGWYCPVPPGDAFQSTMSVANLGESELGLRRSAVGGTIQSEVEELTVPAGHTSNKLVGEFGIPDSIGLAEGFGSGNSAHLTVLAQGVGVASTACSAQPSPRWLFAHGSTARGEDHVLLVSNPFREEAVVSVRLLAADQEIEPANLRDRVIRTHSQAAFRLSDFALEEPGFGIEVTASRGRVVVARYTHITAGDGRGISLEVGARAPSNSWVFAEGNVPSDGEESIVLANPGDREALVSVVFMTGDQRSAPPELAEIPVPAARQVTVRVSEHLPRGSGYGMELTSTNGVPVVAERVRAGVADGNRSYESTFGVTSPARRWTVPAGSPQGGAASLSIVNVGQEPVEVGVTLLTEEGEARPPDLASIVLAAGRKVVVDLAPDTGGGLATALVEADQPVIAVESRVVLGSPYAEFATTAGQAVP